jgi:site-specific recombinase XerD
MFKSLFHSGRVLARHVNSPLAEERSTFLTHLALVGSSRLTLLRYATHLRVIALLLDKHAPDHLSREVIDRCARRWVRRQRQRGRGRGLKWSAKHFVQVACAWCRFMGWLHKQPRLVPVDAGRLQAWAAFLRTEEGLAETSATQYGWWAEGFLRWLKEQAVPLRRVTVARVDGYLKHLASRGLSRVTLAIAATALRRFFRYAYAQEWCRQEVAPVILAPRLFQQENLPAGPTWPEVRRLIAATQGTTSQDLRNRAILLLLAVYGLRSGEVRALRLEDLDWTRRILRVRRSKCARVQEYPLTRAMGQTLRRYLKEARPHSRHDELFLTLQAPVRPLSSAAMYMLTRRLLDRLQIVSPKRGPHVLRHACATYLLNSGLSLKAVGDHLGHRSLTATQIYAKVDLAGLRTVAAFDLGGLL